MGRSGGGSRSGGGFHSSSHSHHSGGFHHSSYHHHSSGYHHSYYHGSSGTCDSIVCSVCLIPIAFIAFVAFIVVVLMSDTKTVLNPTLTQCEQVIACPSSLRENKISFVSKGKNVVATLVSTTPPISTTPSTTILDIGSKTLFYNEYAYRSFNLVKGSTLYWDIKGDYNFVFTLLRGIDNMKRYEDYYDYNYLKQQTYIRSTNYSYTASSSDEYFIIVEAAYSKVSLDTIVYSVEHLRYEVEDKAVKSCTDSCDFDVDASKFPGPCVVAEMACEYEGSSTDVEISYYGAHTTLFYVCLVLAVIGGICVIGLILACVICATRKSKVSGQTYETLPSSTVAPAPAPATYPAGYQTPQPTAAPSAYAQPNYTPVAPAYASVDPSAPAYAYNPTPSYGTATPSY